MRNPLIAENLLQVLLNNIRLPRHVVFRLLKISGNALQNQ